MEKKIKGLNWAGENLFITRVPAAGGSRGGEKAPSVFFYNNFT